MGSRQSVRRHRHGTGRSKKGSSYAYPPRQRPLHAGGALPERPGGPGRRLRPERPPTQPSRAGRHPAAAGALPCRPSSLLNAAHQSRPSPLPPFQTAADPSPPPAHPCARCSQLQSTCRHRQSPSKNPSGGRRRRCHGAATPRLTQKDTAQLHGERAQRAPAPAAQGRARPDAVLAQTLNPNHPSVENTPPEQDLRGEEPRDALPPHHVHHL